MPTKAKLNFGPFNCWFLLFVITHLNYLTQAELSPPVLDTSGLIFCAEYLSACDDGLIMSAES